jgi:hypothetical protein
VTLATAALALANPLAVRQDSNTNPQIGTVLDALAVNNREVMADIGMLYVVWSDNHNLTTVAL